MRATIPKTRMAPIPRGQGWFTAAPLAGRHGYFFFFGAAFFAFAGAFLAAFLVAFFIDRFSLNIKFATSQRPQCDSYIRFFEKKVKRKMHARRGPERKNVLMAICLNVEAAEECAPCHLRARS